MGTVSKLTVLQPAVRMVRILAVRRVCGHLAYLGLFITAVSSARLLLRVRGGQRCIPILGGEKPPESCSRRVACPDTLGSVVSPIGGAHLRNSFPWIE